MKRLIIGENKNAVLALENYLDTKYEYNWRYDVVGPITYIVTKSIIIQNYDFEIGNITKTYIYRGQHFLEKLIDVR